MDRNRFNAEVRRFLTEFPLVSMAPPLIDRIWRPGRATAMDSSPTFPKMAINGKIDAIVSICRATLSAVTE